MSIRIEAVSPGRSRRLSPMAVAWRRARMNVWNELAELYRNDVARRDVAVAQRAAAVGRETGVRI